MDMKVFRVGMLICMLTAVKMEKLKSQLLHAKENPVNSYRETPARINDLIHTRLEVSFDYKKRYLYGKEWVTLKPHFFSTDSLRLDAKGMQINNVSIVKNGRKAPLEYTYDSLTLNIRLIKLITVGNLIQFLSIILPNHMNCLAQEMMAEGFILLMLMKMNRTSPLKSGPRAKPNTTPCGFQR